MDLVEFLENLGFSPQKINGDDYWYLSPLRREKTASFKVSRQLNLWYDHGTGQGGSLIDFAMAHFDCSLKEVLHRITSDPIQNHSCHLPQKSVQVKAFSGEGKIKIIAERPIQSFGLMKYL